MSEHLETMFASFSVVEVNYVIGNVYRPTNSNNNDFLADISNILNTSSTDFPVFYNLFIYLFTVWYLSLETDKIYLSTRLLLTFQQKNN